jgi:monovalent cation:H+ antiporter, CPA1 family
VDPSLPAVRIFAALTLAAALVAILTARRRAPDAVGLLVLGLAAGVVIPAGSLVVTPGLVLAVLLPGLVFDAAFRTHADPFRWARTRIVFLAVPGVVVTAVVVAAILSVAAGVSIQSGLVIGAMVAATDPAAVVATFRGSAAPPRLRTLVEGESLFNDGTGFALFAVMLRLPTHQPGALEVALEFVVAIALSVGVGALVSWVAIRLHHLIDDHLVEAVLTVAAAYGSYVVADWIGGSGLLATAVTGLLVGSRGRGVAISAASAQALDLTWEVVGFLLTALTFLLVGVSIPLGELVAHAGTIAAGLFAVVVARVVVIYGLLGAGGRIIEWAAARRRGSQADPGDPPQMPAAWLHVLLIAGIRGAVTVALALSLPLDFPDRTLIQAVTLGVVLVTLAGLGLAAGPLVPRLLGPALPAMDWPRRLEADTADPDFAEMSAEEDTWLAEPEDL